MSEGSNFDHKKGKSYKIALTAMMTAVALIFSYLEVLIPLNFGFPGIKLGLSNLVVLTVLYILGAKAAFTVNIVRICLAGLLFGGMAAMIYSLAGGLMSFVLMVALKKTKWFSPVGVSMAGGVFHNIGQITVAALVTETSKIFLYLPVLLISGMITGILLGILSAYIIDKIKFY